MKTLVFFRSIEALVLDVDNTIYQTDKAYLAEGTQGEIAGVARILGLSFEQTMTCVRETQHALAHSNPNHGVTMTETVYRLGITPEDWSQLRLKAWRPEQWIDANAAVSNLIASLARRYLIAFGTNSPVEVGRRIIRLIGIGTEVVPDSRIFGPENLGVSKPNPRFYSIIAKAIQVPACNCVSIGDREFSDGPPAIEAGFAGAIIVSGSRDELLNIEHQLTLQ